MGIGTVDCALFGARRSCSLALPNHFTMNCDFQGGDLDARGAIGTLTTSAFYRQTNGELASSLNSGARGDHASPVRIHEIAH
jgi:hypothetical protein